MECLYGEKVENGVTKHDARNPPYHHHLTGKHMVRILDRVFVNRLSKFTNSSFSVVVMLSQS